MEKAVQTSQRTDQELSSVQFLTITAAFVALTYIFTAFINVKLPIAANGGLIHLGNVPLFIGAILFGKKTGAIAGGIGMGLFDLLSGWTLWAPFTLIIVGIMGFTVGKLTEDPPAPEHEMVCDCHCRSLRDQGCGILHCRGYHLWKSTGTGIFHPGKPGPDRCCSCHRSHSDHTIKPCSKKNRIKKTAVTAAVICGNNIKIKR